MVTAGQDCKMAVWDIRMFKEVNSYYTRAPAASLAISDTGLTAVGWGTHTTIWKDLYSKHEAVQEKVQSPYMVWGGEGKRIERVRWCPLEDILGVGHDDGFSSLIIPGAGQANFDAFAANPFETVKQRQESEVKGLLNKLQPEMIALDPNFIGNLDLRSEQQRREEQDLDSAPIDTFTRLKNKARGKNSALKKYMRKQKKKNIIDANMVRVEELLKEQERKKRAKEGAAETELGPALSRFAKKE
jgi:U3 small nucleolar RNA-associated protein 7